MPQCRGCTLNFHMPRLFPFVHLVLLGHLLLAQATASSSVPVEQQRQIFLRAEQAIKQGPSSEAERLMAELGDYPLFPYLLYQKLLRELDDTPSVEHFLNRYGETRQAILLRQRWL